MQCTSFNHDACPLYDIYPRIKRELVFFLMEIKMRELSQVDPEGIVRLSLNNLS